MGTRDLSSQTALVHGSPHGSEVHVFVLIDALGWRFIEGEPFLSDMLPYRRPLRTMLGYSSGIIPSILSGLTPVESGIWNLVYYDPEQSPFRWMRPLAPLARLLDNRIGRRLVTEFGRRILRLGRGFDCCVPPRLLPWFNWGERGNIYARGGLRDTPSIFDRLSAQEIAYRAYSYHELSDAQILETATRDVAAGAEKFFFVYLCEMDGFLHAHCTERDAVRARMAWYESGLRRLFAAARARDPQASFCVFSDHGMTPVRKQYDVAADVRGLGFEMPRDYLAVYDATMARFWFFDERARKAITEALHAVPRGHVLSESELRELSLAFPDNRFGDLILLMEPGCMVAGNGFEGASGWLPAGMHGFHPDDPDSDAVFLADHEPACALRDVRDVFTLMQEAVQ